MLVDKQIILHIATWEVQSRKRHEAWHQDKNSEDIMSFAQMLLKTIQIFASYPSSHSHGSGK